MSNTHLTIDEVEDRGSSFSIVIPLGVRIYSYIITFTSEETKNLEEIEEC